VKKSLQGQIQEKTEDYLTRIIANVTRMNDIIEDMLMLSKISRQELNPEQIDLSLIAETVVAEIRGGEPARKVDIRIGTGLSAIADRGLMTTVLENLIGNAWKFTAGTADAYIEFGCMVRSADNAFFVRDNGVGFDPEFAKNMFKPFHRLHSDNEYEGLGIGLSIVERIINQHGGEVWAEGAVGKGTTIFFTLPPRGPQ